MNSGLELTIEGSNGPFELEASHVFVATGRQPNTDELGLETIGVEISDAGIVAVYERLATNVKGIWAAGDIRWANVHPYIMGRLSGVDVATYRGRVTHNPANRALCDLH